MTDQRKGREAIKFIVKKIGAQLAWQLDRESYKRIIKQTDRQVETMKRYRR